MILDIQVQSETEEEIEFLEKMVEAREHGLDETDMSRAEVAGIFSQFAAGIATEGETEENEESELPPCPECGKPVEDVEAGSIGGDPVVRPCGCSTVWAELPPDLYME